MTCRAAASLLGCILAALAYSKELCALEKHLFYLTIETMTGA